MPPGRVGEKLRHSPQDDLELHRREHGLLLAGLRAVILRSRDIFGRLQRTRNIKDMPVPSVRSPRATLAPAVTVAGGQVLRPGAPNPQPRRRLLEFLSEGRN